MDYKRFDDEANIHYRLGSIDDLTKEVLEQIVQHHYDVQRPRLKTLEEYYKGENVNILTGQRRKEKHLADNRATHNFARYVSQFIQGYLVGNPVKTEYPEDDIEELIVDLNRHNNEAAHNSDLALDQSIFGRAYEMVYRNEQDEVRYTQLSSLDTFVIYDMTVECRPLAGVRRIENQFTDEVYILVYTDKHIHVYNLNEGREVTLSETHDHHFGEVPIIEYENNKYRQGDFEDVLSLIDLYDAAQSDTANYMQDLNDAMLKIAGNLDIDLEQAKEMRDANILMLQTTPSEGMAQQRADADYIYKKYDVQGTEAYKDRLFNNILLFTSIPNLLDEEGMTAQSGEALKMKLFALSQKRATKERMFEKALRQRYTLINNIMELASEATFDPDHITFSFTENLPSMINKELEWFTKAGGVLSQETLINNLSFVDNAQEELERIEAEDKQIKRTHEMYEFPTIELEEVEEVELDE